MCTNFPARRSRIFVPLFSSSSSSGYRPFSDDFCLFQSKILRGCCYYIKLCSKKKKRFVYRICSGIDTNLLNYKKKKIVVKNIIASAICERKSLKHVLKSLERTQLRIISSPRKHGKSEALLEMVILGVSL